jgi:hypothetical protein
MAERRRCRKALNALPPLTFLCPDCILEGRIMRRSRRSFKLHGLSGPEPEQERSLAQEGSGKKLHPDFLRLVGRCLCRGLLVGLVFALLFSLVVAYSWFTAGDREALDILLYINGVLALGGFLFGMGWEINKTFAEPESPRSPEQEAQKARDAAIQLTKRFIVGPSGPVSLLLKWLRWFAAKDFGAQKPGRGKRALIGALFLGGGGAGVFSFLAFVQGLSVFFVLGAVLFACLAGAVLGALSDSF